MRYIPFEIDYRDLLPKKPAVIIAITVLPRFCLQCLSPFVTGSRTKFRCQPCQDIRDRAVQDKHNAKQRAKVRARRQNA